MRTAPSANLDLGTPEILEARLNLAACFRMAARMGMHEGICNHLSALVPGRSELFFVNPLGLSFDEITASNLLICDFNGNVVQGEGRPESTAFHIHARVHQRHPRAAACFHTHMSNATALCMIAGEPLSWASQTSLKFYGRIAVDEHFGGLALDGDEGDRIAAVMGNAAVVFLKNHGVMVVGPTIGEVWDDLYYLERACELERIARSIGGVLKPVDLEIARQTSQQWSSFAVEAGGLHLESIKRRLNTLDPSYRN